MMPQTLNTLTSHGKTSETVELFGNLISLWIISPQICGHPWILKTRLCIRTYTCSESAVHRRYWQNFWRKNWKTKD